MGLRNLYNVTRTLINLLRENITKNIDTSLDGLLNVTAIPPEKVENPTNTLSLHLYHVAEDPFYKNALGPGNDAPNVAKAPMALSLFYILTAHHENNPEFDAETQQKLMGYALKTFHDFPVITSKTRINGSPILDPEFGDDAIQTVLRPVTPEEAISFWNTQESNTARLSSYYEVRVVMLRPEPPKTMPGIVLNLGAFVIQLGSAHLERSQSLARFKIPEKNGGTFQEIEAAPARVTLDTSATPPAAHNRLLLFGANITRGRSRSLFLRNSVWAKLGPPDGPIEESVVDLEVNPDWSVDFQTDRVTVKLAPALRHVKPGGASVNLPLLPGFYNALVRSVMDEQVINNELKRITVSSNEVSFAVSPRIQGHGAPDAGGNIQINLGPEFDPLDPTLAEGAIQLVVAGEVYTRVNADPPANAKEFFVANSPSNLIRIRPHFPVTVTQPEAHPFLVIVNGAESAPFWIELNP